MIRNPRNLLWAIPLALFISSPLWHPLLAAFLAPRGGYNLKLAQSRVETPLQNFVMESVAITLTSKGIEEWQIDAERAFTSPEHEHEIEMEAVSAIYIGTGREPINIESRKGAYRIDNRHLILTEQVKVVKPTKNQRLLSERLEYDDASKMLTSPGKATIITPESTLNAGSMKYDFATEGFDFGNRVKVKL
jgi:LPS export ABC transporter protein LptC